MTLSFGSKDVADSGTIVLWAGLLSDIPAGWVLCDGNNGTPNLLDRYPKSVPDTATDPGTTGGTDSVTLTTTEIPSHNHPGTTDSAGDHSHTIVQASDSLFAEEDYHAAGGGFKTGSTTSDGSHSHSASFGSTGSGNAIDLHPGYYEVAYIMKT